MTKINTQSENPESTKSNAVPEDEIGSRIRSARESLGLSQTAVATRTKLSDPKKQGISRTVLVGYEAGHSKPGAREIRLLCEILKVSPNWLIFGTENGHETQQASMDAVRLSSDFIASIRLGLAISALRPHERSALSSLVLSMAGRELGDLRLSSLFALSGILAPNVFLEIRKQFPEQFDFDNPYELSLDELMNVIASNSPNTNIGNKLIFDEEGNPVGGEWLYPETKKD